MTEPRDPASDETEGPPSPLTQPATAGTELRTFLIADIRGYTTYTRERGDEAGATLATRFGELVAEVVPAHDGFLLELRGDEALVVFVSARKALRAAIDLQARFVQAELPRGVGIGLDAGEAIPVANGYRGTALNLAARLCAEAGPGETLASEAVIHLAAKMDGIAYVDARALRLKGYVDSVRVVDVVPSERAKGRRIASGDGARGPRTREAAAVVAVFLVVVFVGGVLGGGLLGRGGPSPSASPLATPTSSPDPLGGAELPVLAFYDGKTGALKATTHLTAPRNIAFYSKDSFWILGENPRAFNRIDASHKVAQSISVPVVEPSGYNFDDDSLWITDLAGPRVVRVDKRTQVPSTFAFGKDADDQRAATDVAVGAGSVWLARPGDGLDEITRIDAETGEVQARIPVIAFGLAFGEGALWYWAEGRIGRIDPFTNEPTFDELQLGTVGWLGNIYFGGGYAWTAESTTGLVWRIDRSGRRTSYALAPGVGEMAATQGTMWVTNANTGKLTGIDFVTGQQSRVIDAGHAVLAVAANGEELMIAVGPTVDEAIADLEGSVLTVSVSGRPWTEGSPDPAINGSWEVRQVLYLTCVGLLNYPDKPAPDGWTLVPEVAEGMPTLSADGRTYTFRIKSGFQFSPPSNEAVTAETFRATIERTLSTVFDDFAPGPQLFSDIVGAKEYREGTARTVTGLVADGDRLTITLEAPAPDFLARLALSFACPVPSRTDALRSGVNPDPPVSGAGPYYVAQKLQTRLIVLKKNPNYHGPRAQPFDAIAIRQNTAPATAIDEVQRGTVDAAMLPAFEPLTGSASAIAMQWGPGSASAASGDQRWWGAARFGVDYIALNASRPAFSDPDVRRAVSLALDRSALASTWVTGPNAALLAPGLPGSVVPAAPATPPDLEAASALMKGRTFEVTMQGFPAGEDCGVCRDFESEVKRQLKAIGITVTVVHGDGYPADALEPGSTVDLLQLTLDTDVADPVDLLGGLREDVWLGDAVFDELTRLEGLSGQPRIDGAVALAKRLVDEQALVLPTGHWVLPFFISERIGCGFVQPAIGAVDLLSLCIKDGATPTSSASPSP